MRCSLGRASTSRHPGNVLAGQGRRVATLIPLGHPFLLSRPLPHPLSSSPLSSTVRQSICATVSDAALRGESGLVWSGLACSGLLTTTIFICVTIHLHMTSRLFRRLKTLEFSNVDMQCGGYFFNVVCCCLFHLNKWACCHRIVLFRTQLVNGPLVVRNSCFATC